MKTQSVVISAICLSLLFVCSCQNKKPSDLNDEEKINFKISYENQLSDDEMENQKRVRKQILDRTNAAKKSADAITNALNNAKSVLSDTTFVALQTAQENWAKQTRGKDINKLVQKGMAAPDAFVQSAFDRAQWIQTRTSQAMLIEMPGTFGGFYQAPPDRTLEIYEMPNQHINVVLRLKDADFIYTASGSFLENQAKIASERDPNAAVLINISSPDTLTLELTPTFAASQIANSGALIEGRFKRVKQGELDVFAP